MDDSTSVCVDPYFTVLNLAPYLTKQNDSTKKDDLIKQNDLPKQNDSTKHNDSTKKDSLTIEKERNKVKSHSVEPTNIVNTKNTSLETDIIDIDITALSKQQEQERNSKTNAEHLSDSFSSPNQPFSSSHFSHSFSLLNHPLSSLRQLFTLATLFQPAKESYQHSHRSQELHQQCHRHKSKHRHKSQH